MRKRPVRHYGKIPEPYLASEIARRSEYRDLAPTASATIDRWPKRRKKETLS